MVQNPTFLSTVASGQLKADEWPTGPVYYSQTSFLLCLFMYHLYSEQCHALVESEHLLGCVLHRLPALGLSHVCSRLEPLIRCDNWRLRLLLLGNASGVYVL